MLGIWATSWEKLTIVPSLVITPLAFLGGSFYSLDVLPPLWRTVTLFNPVVYLVSTFRWCFHLKSPPRRSWINSRATKNSLPDKSVSCSLIVPAAPMSPQ
jgi:ABC-type polysaccharide/polyol phosphate export permease